MKYWVPSIAPSGMAFYTGDLFPAWRGNLFVGALARRRCWCGSTLDGEQGRPARSGCCKTCASASATCGRARTARSICSPTAGTAASCASRPATLITICETRRTRRPRSARSRPRDSSSTAPSDNRKAGEHHERDDLLHGLELRRRIDGVALAVGRHRQAILDEGEPPAEQDHRPERHLLEAQVPVPGDGHEHIGADQQQNRREIGRKRKWAWDNPCW